MTIHEARAVSPSPITFIVTVSNIEETPSSRTLQRHTARSHIARVSHRSRRTKLHYSTSHLVQHYTTSFDKPTNQAQWRCTPQRAPAVKGLQVLDPFSDPGDHTALAAYDLIRFHNIWSPAASCVLPLAIQNRACLYTLALTAAVNMRNVRLRSLSSQTELELRSAALAAIRRQLSSVQIDADGLKQALVYLLLGTLPDVAETRLHLTALARLVKNINELPQHLLEVVRFCDVTASVAFFNPTIFRYDYSLTGYIGSTSSEPSLEILAQAIKADIIARDLPQEFVFIVSEFLKFSNALLDVLSDPSTGYNVPIVYHKSFCLISRCLTLAEVDDDDNTVKTMTQMIILWCLTLIAAIGDPMALAAAMGTWGRFESSRPAPPAADDDDVPRFSNQTRKIRLHLWLREVELFKSGAGIDQAVLVENLYQIISAAFDDRPIWAFVVEYLRLSVQRSSMQVPQDLRRCIPEHEMLQSRICGPILGRWKIVSAA